MSVQLNHTIVWCSDKERSASFLTEILGRSPSPRFGHFLVVETDNEVSLDFDETDDEITAQHYAFLVGEAEFDGVFDRISKEASRTGPIPGGSRPAYQPHDGGRGIYFEDPDGHLLELSPAPMAAAPRARYPSRFEQPHPMPLPCHWKNHMTGGPGLTPLLPSALDAGDRVLPEQHGSHSVTAITPT